MSDSIGAPAQHKQPSRKGKKAWRKNVDITEVQTGLETLREEIIQGGPIAEKPSDELFALDTTGSDDIKKQYRLAKPLKVDEILAKRSAVPAVDSRKRGYTTDGVIELSSKKLKGDWVSKKEVARLRQVADRTSHLSNEQIEDSGSGFDLWAQRSDQLSQDQALEFIPKPKTKVAPATLKKAPIAMTASGKAVPAVKKPDAGTSYNPSFEEWDNLLNRVGAEEVAAEQARLKQAQDEADKQARIAAAGADDTGARTDNESEWEGFETDAEEGEMIKHKRPKRKTPAERNKLNRRRKVEQLAKHERRTGDKQRQAQQIIESMLAVAKTSEDAHIVEKMKENLDQVDSDVDESKLRRRKLGKAPIPEKNLELVLPDELQESLRLLKPEGNLLQDRSRHLLVNGKVENRKPVLQPKKKKTKATEKWSHKDFSVAV